VTGKQGDTWFDEVVAKEWRAEQAPGKEKERFSSAGLLYPKRK
jgi:hypothetical protein